jgi:hypothetical protein
MFQAWADTFRLVHSVVAVMLGVLHMDVDNCIHAYVNLMRALRRVAPIGPSSEAAHRIVADTLAIYAEPSDEMFCRAAGDDSRV